MPRILFLWPPKLEYIFSLQKHHTGFGETLAALSASEGFEVDVMDGSALMHVQWDFLAAFARGYDYLVVYTDLHNSISAMRAAQQCKRIAPETVTISYGQAVPYAWQTLLQQGFDAAILDSIYHRAIISFIRSRLGQTGKGQLSGVAFLDGTGNPVHVSAEPIGSIADHPYPALDRLPVEQYKRVSGRNQLCFTVAKGCPYNCRFCRVPIAEGRRTKYRPVSDVVEYASSAGRDFASVKFIAPTFTADGKWVRSLCREIGHRGTHFKWIVTTRVELLDEELVSDMAGAGCAAIAFGLESLYAETQSRIDKVIPRESLLRQVSLMHQYGIIPKAFVMLGIPGQTASEVEEMFRFLKDHGIEIRPKEYYPYQLLTDAPEHGKLQLLRLFERDDVNKMGMEGVQTGDFVRWLTHRTAIR